MLPQMADVMAQPYHWRPYLMRQGAPHFRSASLNTDAHGFRLSSSPRGPVGVDALHAWSGRRGAVLGNSALYGVGVSCDGATVPSRFNEWGEAAGWCWVNLSLRASVLWQERQALELYLPERMDAVLWISGVNDLVAAGLGGSDLYLPPFLGQPRFETRMNGRASAAMDEEVLLEATLARLPRVLAPLARLQDAGVTVAFVLQPLLTWLDKPLSFEEAWLVAEFDTQPNRLHRVHRAERMGPLHRPLSEALRAACGRWGIPYWDANTSCPGFADEAWLFVDRIHLTDRGHWRLARWLWGTLTAQA